VLVFVEKQEKADELVGDLMKHGYNCAPLHGQIDQFDRDSTIIDFKSGKIKLLVIVCFRSYVELFLGCHIGGGTWIGRKEVGIGCQL